MKIFGVSILNSFIFCKTYMLKGLNTLYSTLMR